MLGLDLPVGASGKGSSGEGLSGLPGLGSPLARTGGGKNIALGN